MPVCIILWTYDKGKARIKEYIEDEKPEYVSLALDGWSIHHHGYMGAIASIFFKKWKN